MPGLSFLWHFSGFYIQCLCFTEGDDVIPLECSDEAEELRGLFGLADILPTLPHKDEAKEGIYFDRSV